MRESSDISSSSSSGGGGGGGGGGREGCRSCRSFGQKCSHIVKKQRAKFYIVRRCIAMLVCWRDRGDP